MMPRHVYYQWAVLGLLWFCLMWHSLAQSRRAGTAATGSTRAPQAQALP
jgi:hypothetical protein